MTLLGNIYIDYGFILGMGAILGSFANVVIYRLPEGKSVLGPGSYCRKCKTPVKWFDNIPVFSWFFLRGRCRTCSENISFRYPLVEIIMAILFLLCYLHVGLKWVLIEYLIFIFGLVVITFIDIDHFIIPDTFSIGGILVGLVGAYLNPERGLLEASLGVLMGGGFFWAIAWIYYIVRKQEGIGGGDIKLLAWIGAVLGWPSIPFIIVSSSLIGGIAGLLTAYKKKSGLKTVIPYGPYLAFGAVLYLFGGYHWGFWYLRIFFPWMQSD